MPCCAYSGCTNHTDFGKTLGISFHRFPRNPQAAERWASACGRTEVFSVLTARVCSEHFLDEDYERDLKSELMNTDRKRLLRHSAVPSLSPSRPRSSISAYRCGLKRITKRRARNRTENSVGIPGDPNFVDDLGVFTRRRSAGKWIETLDTNYLRLLFTIESAVRVLKQMVFWALCENSLKDLRSLLSSTLRRISAAAVLESGRHIR
ncbi:hypothetical protein J6590_066691 [Homalodisca vitripennis]|nr:hypothetical protein J6590_066691 [Homalodisca vitripennis]